jgi:hypothetical protein
MKKSENTGKSKEFDIFKWVIENRKFLKIYESEEPKQ